MKSITELTTLTNYDLSKYNILFIDKAIQQRVQTLSLNSTDEYYKILEANASEATLFLSSLQINYSEFFRNTLTFATLEKIVLPSIILQKKASKNKEVRIWSAACAGGQEPYSLAILLEELLEQDISGVTYRIFATDQTQEVIDEAKVGIFHSKAINNVTHANLEKWFTKSGNLYTISDHLKSNIDFSPFDLLDNQHSSPPSSIFGNFDLVFCANLLFYYMPEYQDKIIKKTTNSLTSKGYFITGEAERDILQKHKLREIYPQSAIYQK